MAARAGLRLVNSCALQEWRVISPWNGGSRCWINMSRLSPSVGGKLSPLQERRMVDKFSVHVRGGQGGSGCTSFRKSRHSRHGFADGGNGGSGGSVILVSSAAVWDFSNLQHHLNAKKGCPGTSKRKVGSRGADKVVQVPVGTVIQLLEGSVPLLELQSVTPDQSRWDEFGSNISRNTLGRNKQEFEDTDLIPVISDSSREESSHECSLFPEAMSTDERKPSSHSHSSDHVDSTDTQASEAISLLTKEDGVEHTLNEEDCTMPPRSGGCVVEFVKPGQSFIVARGGEGGRGNASMSRGRGALKSLPSLEHEPGQPGSEAVLMLELKTLADVGLVGMPNAGKSTLLGALSRAQPAIGNYAFTTLRPNIGKLEFDDFFSMTVADIPGLIEGAHENRGLGHDFLRHIERTKALAYVVDLAAGLGENRGRMPWDQLKELMFELEQYQTGLSHRPSVVVANKIDEDGAETALEELRKRVQGVPVYPVCAILGDGIQALKDGLRDLVDGPEPASDQTSCIEEVM